MPEFKDIKLTCLCGRDFIWTAGEQEFLNDLKERGKIPTVQTPKRCASCRKAKRAEKESASRE